MRTLLFFLIILVCNIGYGQLPITSDHIIVLVTSQDECPLSRSAERHFKQASVSSFIRAQKYQYVHYYGQQIGEYRQRWGVTHYPSVVYLRKINGQWYRAGIFSPVRTKMTLLNVQAWLGMKANRSLPTAPEPYCPPGGS